MRFNNGFDPCQTQTEAFLFCAGPLRPVEGVKYAGEIRRINPDSLVLYGHHHFSIRLAAGYGDGSLCFRKLDRIVQQITEHPSQPLGIRFYDGKRRFKNQFQNKTLFRDPWLIEFIKFVKLFTAVLQIMPKEQIPYILYSTGSIPVFPLFLPSSLTSNAVSYPGQYSIHPIYFHFEGVDNQASYKQPRARATQGI